MTAAQSRYKLLTLGCWREKSTTTAPIWTMKYFSMTVLRMAPCRPVPSCRCTCRSLYRSAIFVTAAVGSKRSEQVGTATRCCRPPRSVCSLHLACCRKSLQRRRTFQRRLCLAQMPQLLDHRRQLLCIKRAFHASHAEVNSIAQGEDCNRGPFRHAES